MGTVLCMPVAPFGRYSQFRQYLFGFYAKAFQGVWHQESIWHERSYTFFSVMDRECLDGTHRFIFRMVLYRDVFRICQSFAGKQRYVYSFRLAALFGNIYIVATADNDLSLS